MSDLSKDNELLILEYQECQNGYNNRDNLVQQEFASFIQTFFAFLTLLFAVHIFAEVNLLLNLIIHVGLGIVGLLALLAFLFDMEANTSCKVALRKRSTEIEALFSHTESLKIWSVIQDRDKYFEEKLFKGRPQQTNEKTTGSVFINTSRTLIVLWITFVIVIILLGDSIKFR